VEDDDDDEDDGEGRATPALESSGRSRGGRGAVEGRLRWNMVDAQMCPFDGYGGFASMPCSSCVQ